MRTIAGLAGTTTGTLTDRAMIVTTSDLVVQAEVDRARHIPAAANRVTTREVRRQRTVIRIAGVTALAHVLGGLAVAEEAVDITRALEAEMVSTDMYLEEVVVVAKALLLPLPLPLPTHPLKTTSTMIVGTVSVMTADPGDERTVVIAIKATGLAIMIAGRVVATEGPASMNLIVMFQVVVVEMIRLLRRSLETEVEVATEIETVAGMIATRDDEGAEVEVAIDVDDSHDDHALYYQLSCMDF